MLAVASAIVATALGAALWIVSGAPHRVRDAPAGGLSSRPPATPPGSPATPAARPPVWQVAWGSAMAWAYGSVEQATVRSLARVAIGGDAVEVRISNRFGRYPLSIGDATIAPSEGGPKIAVDSAVALTFGGGRQVSVPPGGSVTSDPADLAVSSEETVAVSVYVVGFDTLTSHYPCCELATPSFLSRPGSGDLTAASGELGFGYEDPWSRLVDAVSVERPAGSPGSVVVLGDSISDGFNSNIRWPHLLQERVDALPASQRLAVVNEANTANTLTAVTPSDATTGGAPPGVDRLGEDALDLPGVSTIVLLLGTNDLYFGAPASQVVAGMRTVVAEAHSRGVRVVGVTLPPRQQGPERWTPAQQAALEQVDDWMVTSGVFDGVFDDRPVLGDVYDGSCDPFALFPAYDSGDHLHLSPAGATAMADAFPPQLIGLPALPLLPPMVAVTPTKGCDPSAVTS